jgi:hypothetical protein
MSYSHNYDIKMASVAILASLILLSVRMIKSYGTVISVQVKYVKIGR